MNHLSIVSLVILVLSTASASSSAQAGVKLTMEHREANGSVRNHTKIFWNNGKARVEGANTPGGTAAPGMVAIATDKSLLLIDEPKKSYIEMTEKDLERMSRMLEQAQTLIEAQMKSLNAEQRAQMAKQLGGAGMGSGKVIEYRKTKSGVKCAKWTCDEYEMLSDGKKVAEKLFSKEIGISKKTFDAATMFKLMQKIASSGAMRKLQPKIKGMPQAFEVVSKNFLDGKLIGTSELIEAKEEPLPESLFAAPADYQKKSMEMMPFGK